MVAGGVKHKFWAAWLRVFDGRVAAEGGVAEKENPDDAAVENIVIGVAVT